MLKAFSLFGFGAVFLMMSPKLRGSAWGLVVAGVNGMEIYAPFSYIIGAILVFFTMIFAFFRSSRPR